MFLKKEQRQNLIVLSNNNELQERMKALLVEVRALEALLAGFRVIILEMRTQQEIHVAAMWKIIAEIRSQRDGS
jgi:hypothetical protein